ncbi:MAG: acetyltransferase [Chromatiales bacterium]|nr:acetyltransferase [Gammaproteobacteria bacterium]MCP5231106.1 acetyltransferase [Zoogloeaceae bacterium]MCP5351721.1 acetyltransferase [Chromatiales bacterium]
MFLKSRDNGDLVEVLDTAPLFDPFQSEVPGCMHAGEEMQDARNFAKSGLVFPSGEALPRCWMDGNYRAA